MTKIDSIVDIQIMINRAVEFDDALRAAINAHDVKPISAGTRKTAGCAYVEMILEHGDSFRALLCRGNSTSALALIRPQFEATLRGWWITFAAKENWISRLADSAKDPEIVEPGFQSIPVLLDELEASKALDETFGAQGMAISLRALSAKSIKYLHSLTHGGRGPMVHILIGPKPELLAWMIRTSNSLGYAASQLYACIANDPSLSNALSGIRNKFPETMHAT
jgi:hypothetical protein